MVPAVLFLKQLRAVSNRPLNQHHPLRRQLLGQLIQDLESSRLYVLGEDTENLGEFLANPQRTIVAMCCCGYRQPTRSYSALFHCFQGPVTAVETSYLHAAADTYADLFRHANGRDMDTILIPDGAKATILMALDEDKLEPIILIHRDLTPDQGVALVATAIDMYYPELAFRLASQPVTIN